MKKILLYILISTFSVSTVLGQQSSGKSIRMENITLRKSETGKLIVSGDLTVDKEFKISTNRGLTLTPILKNKEYVKTLPSIILYGKKREIMSRRNKEIPSDAYSVIRRKQNSEQTVHYQSEVVYENWMQAGKLFLIENVCGCGNFIEENYETLLANVPTFETGKIPSEVEKTKPALPVKPQSTPPVVKRFKEGSANICFPVNKTSIYPDYLNNPAELNKIITTIEEGDDIEFITHISIHAYASPEGNLTNNRRLAEQRAEALKKYLTGRYHFNDSIFSIDSTPEDWEGFRKLVMDSNLNDKETILSIIDSNKDLDTKESELKKLGNTYTYIVKEWFPLLRHLNYKVEYTFPENDQNNHHIVGE